MPASALLCSPVDTVSSRSTDPALEAALLAQNAVYADQATAGAVVAFPPTGAVADEPWGLHDPPV
eukprot:5654613-Lingulodinium_polyedra.AAC.1